MNLKTYLNLIYNHPGHAAFISGAPTLLREAKRKFPGAKLKQIEDFLKTKLEYNLHSERNKKLQKTHPKFYTTSPFQSISCDLAFFSKNHLIYLMCVDDHSGMKYAQYVGNKKTAESTSRAFAEILKKMPTTPARVRIDRGTEFAKLDKMFKDRKIAISHLDTYQKAYNAEKFIGELRRIFRCYKTKTGRQDIRPIIQKIVSSMNNKYNRVTKMTPLQAMKQQNAGLVFERRYLHHLQQGLSMPNPKYKAGDHVRCIIFKNAAEEKSSLSKRVGRYSSTVFSIYKAVPETYPQQYLLQDEQGNIISRRFMERHLIDVKDD